MVNVKSCDKMFILKKSEDPFIILRKVYFKFGYLPAIKHINSICIFFHLLVHAVEIYYSIEKFSTDLFEKYIPLMMVLTYVIVTMIYSVILEKKSLQFIDTLFATAWSTENVEMKRRPIVVNETKKMYYFIVVWMVLFYTFFIFWTPLFGDMANIILVFRIFDEHLWSQLLKYIFIITIPFLFYSASRLCGSLLYAILHVQLQIAILNEQIALISSSEESEDFQYQEMVTGRLICCIEQHVALKKLIKIVHEIVESCIVGFVVSGFLATMGSVFLILHILAHFEFNLFLRIFSLGISNFSVLILFAETGEGVTSQTGRIFNQLLDSSWRLWNKKNRQILLVFLANSIKPVEFSFATIVLNRRLTLILLYKSCQYALIFYNLKNSN